jgi:uncharacterized RDD family membrane protein YckC
MAANEYHHGDQDIAEQKATFSSFIGASKWSSLWIAAAVLLLTVWFCTDAGFMPGAISAVILLIVGYIGLRKKPGASGGH